ncbi:MAG: penicillin-binding transpeptidase domain-containing protein [Oscillospiraceae bacterium]|nr:penicillin-binding transpeptidase domain-containing protein [Oscillospiraceae bacterium]
MENLRRRTVGTRTQLWRRTLVLMVVCGIFAFLLLGGQLFYLQILQHHTLEQRAIAQQVREVTVSASRGTVFSSTGTILAQSASVENVFISPNDIYRYEHDRLLIARGLSEILEVEEDMILERMENIASQYQTIRMHIERELADEVRSFISEHELHRSVHLEPSVRRYYPRERTASHVLGFVGAGGTGMGYGVEGSFDSYLTGVSGRIVRLRSARGHAMMLNSYEDYFSPQPGDDLHLTIDANIQQIMEKHMNQAVRDFDLRGGGIALAMDPRTGAILGMVSLPDFNPNSHGRLSEARMEELRAAFPENDEEFWAAVNEELQYSWMNKAISYSYEPGSTFKLITLAIALEEGIITADTNRIFYCKGYMDVPGRVEPVNCWRRQGHGAQTLGEAMQHSCNPATVELAMDIGPDLFFEYLRAFGLMETTGVDLQGEAIGLLWSEIDWNYFISHGNYSSLAAASFGQTFTLTPIRMVTAVSALTNGGYIHVPHVMERVVAQDGTVVREGETVTRRQVISRETSDAVLDIMEQIVSSPRGTGRNAAIEGFRIGGKTGTSTDTVLEIGNVRQFTTSFVSAAPIDDPEIVLLVALQNPGPNATTYISGGQMAAPVAGAMLREILPYLGLDPNVNRDQQVNVQVPYVRRRTVEEARAELEAEGFRVRIQGEGDRVVDQMPAGGAVVVRGTEVILYLDSNRPEDQVTVPDVTGLRYDEARAALEARGLYVRRSGTLLNHNAVVVHTQSRPPTEIVRRGTVVEITLVDTTLTGFF